MFKGKQRKERKHLLKRNTDKNCIRLIKTNATRKSYHQPPLPQIEEKEFLFTNKEK